MTYKNERWSMCKSLHLLLDLYERDPSVPHTLLSNDLNPFGAFDDDLGRVRLAEQLELLKQTSKNARDEILRKTLIETHGGSIRHAVIQEYLERPDKVPSLYDDPENTKSGFAFMLEIEAEEAAEQGISYAQYKASGVREKLSEKKIEVELLRFFADRIEHIAEAIEKLDDTDFSSLIPDQLVAPFRECHINVVLGNYGTASILCGAILERALQDLLQSRSMLNELINEAKKNGLLSGHNIRYAGQIQARRNAVVHGEQAFNSITYRWVWELLDLTRKLVSELYQGRVA